MTVLFKLGGSLLTLPDLAEKLRFIVRERTGKYCLFLPGGGASADVVREWSRIHDLDDEAAHWLAISCLDLNRQFVEELLGWKSVNSRADVQSQWNDASKWNEVARPLLLKMSEFLKREEQVQDEVLPHNWNVTSDSLAAWTAMIWPAEELVLLKSVPNPIGRSAMEASQENLVDSYFPILANRIPRISWCNLRAPTPVLETWLESPVNGS